MEVVGDIANGVWQMKELLKEQEQNWDFSRFKMIKEHFDAQLAKGQNDNRFPLYPVRIVKDVYDTMPKDGIICLDNGMYKIWFARYYPAHEPNSILLYNALASMGAGAPSVIASNILHPPPHVMPARRHTRFLVN